MAWLFISHSSKDNDVATRVIEVLKSEGFDAVFLDFDDEGGIPPGRDWESVLYSKLRTADAIVFLNSSDALKSPWCDRELMLARAIGRTIVPVILGGADPHPLLDAVQRLDASDGLEHVLQRLVRDLRDLLDPDRSIRLDPNTPPYPGLAAFGTQDGALFFGREKEVKDLKDRLHPTLQRGAQRLVALVGPSGSGKSSLVLGGLVPRLSKRDGWIVLPPIRPGARPVEELARSIARGFQDLGQNMSPKEVANRLRLGPGAFIELARDLCWNAGADVRSLLLVIDQAEELATLVGDQERAVFMSLLRGAFVDTGPLWAIATVRSEFLDGLLADGGMADMLNEPSLLSPLDRARLFDVIEQPAKRKGLAIDAALVARMVDDTVGGDALPLLAYTLRSMWEVCDDRGDSQLRSEDYDTVGGVVGSLQQQADAVHEELQRRGNGDLVLATLMKLATIDGTGEPTRRRIAIDGLSVAEGEVLQGFMEARLLVVNRAPGEAATVEVAHEALLRRWEPLRRAIEDARSDLRTRSELERLSADWVQSRRRDSYLLRGDRLEAAALWASAHQHELGSSSLIGEFLERGRIVASSAPAPDRSHYGVVLRSLVEGSLVVVLGPGVNRVGFMSEAGRPDVAEAAHHIGLTKGRGELERMLTEFSTVNSEPGAVHRFLARIPRTLDELGLERRQQLIVSTNFDKALELAFEEEHEPYDLVVYMATGHDHARFVHIPYSGQPAVISHPNAYGDLPIDDWGELGRTVIVKAYGSVDGNAAGYRGNGNYVITSDDLSNYLSGAPAEDLVPLQILAQLRENHCLFLGSNTDDRSLRVLLQRIWADEPLAARSWAVAEDASGADQPFWARRDIELRASRLADYAERIGDELSQLRASGMNTDRTRPARMIGESLAPAPDERHYDRVARSIVHESSSMVLLLGQGINAAGRAAEWRAGCGSPPDEDELATELAHRFATDGATLPEVAQNVTTNMGRADLNRTLRRVLADAKPGLVHRFIARLPRTLEQITGERRHQLIVSASFDSALERAFDEEHEPYDLAVYTAYGNDAGRFVHIPHAAEPAVISYPNAYGNLPIDDFGELHRTLIVKPYGSVDGHVGGYRWKGNYVITTDDLHDYLTGAPPESLVPVQILQRLRESHSLFLGMHDTFASVLLMRIWGGRPMASSWAIQRKAGRAEDDFWRQSFVDAYTADLGQYVERLTRQLRDGP